MSAYYTPEELADIEFPSIGSNVLISRKASIYHPENIYISSNVRIDDYSILSGAGGIRIGNYVHIAAYSALYGAGGIVLDDFTGLSPRCNILSATDDFSGNSLIHPFFPKKYKPGYVSKAVVLRKFAQVGVNSTILPGVELGEGVAIGADDDTEGAGTAHVWNCETNDDTITMDGTTKGGKLGDHVEVLDYASGKWLVKAFLTQSGGSEVTPFSAAVS